MPCLVAVTPNEALARRSHVRRVFKRRSSAPNSWLLNRPAVRYVDTNAGQGRRPMTVKAILSAKGGDVISIEPTATLETAVKTLAKHGIGALLVLGPDRRVIGILSERDIVRALGEHGADVLTRPLAQVMTRKVVTCGPTETVGTIMERMTTGKFRHVPVVEQDQMVGIISIGDVVKHRVHEMDRESAALRDYIQTA